MQAIAPLTRHYSGAPIALFLLITALMTWFHWRNWPPAWDPRTSPELRLTEQFRHDYPVLPRDSNLLFVTDGFPFAAYDLLFNLRLLYGDKSLQVYRLSGPQDQQPDPDHPPVYTHIFASEGGRYAELDTTDPAASVRLNILRGVTISNEMDMARADHSAYVVKGLKDVGGNQPSRWTDPAAEFKFRLKAKPSEFTVKFWVPEVVAAPPVRTLSVVMNGEELGRLPLNRSGMHEVRLTVPDKAVVAGADYTLVDMKVDKPYQDSNGVRYGVVLLTASFDK